MMKRAKGSPARRTASALLALIAGGCTHKQKPATPPAELAGLAAIPSTARVVLAADPSRLSQSDVVARAFTLLLDKEPDLTERLQHLADGCQIDWRKQITSLHVALTSDAPVPLVIATGQLSEPDVAKCVQTTVGAGGGSLTMEQADDRTLYKVVEGKHTMYFAFGQHDTVALSASRDLVVNGLGNGQKVGDAPEMKDLFGRADTKAPLWAVGQVDASMGQRLQKITRGAVTASPKAFLFSLDPTDGVKVDLAAVMASEADAKAMESQAEGMLDLVALAAQRWQLGPLVAKATATQTSDTVHLGVALSDDEMKEVLSKVDTSAPAAQDAGPARPVDAGVPGD
jgi:hypothetical protein